MQTVGGKGSRPQHHLSNLIPSFFLLLCSKACCQFLLCRVHHYSDSEGSATQHKAMWINCQIGKADVLMYVAKQPWSCQVYTNATIPCSWRVSWRPFRMVLSLAWHQGQSWVCLPCSCCSEARPLPCLGWGLWETGELQPGPPRQGSTTFSLTTLRTKLLAREPLRTHSNHIQATVAGEEAEQWA